MTYQNDIVWLALMPPLLDSINGKLTVLNDLDMMSVVLQQLHSNLLVHHIIFRQEYIVNHSWSIDGLV